MTYRKSTTQIVWEIAGSKSVDGCVEHEGLCFVCVGHMMRGKPVEDWMGSNFTDQNRARRVDATHVCEACCFVHSRIAPVPGRPAKDGKKFGGNWRNYSHMWEDGWDAPAFGDDGTRCPNYANASKGQKPLIREFLARDHKGPWFFSGADSGQKHVIPFTPTNGPGRAGVVLFDELRIQVPGDQSLLGDAMTLLTAGATKEEIETGQYRSVTFERCAEMVLTFERNHKAERGSGWFTLAVWLAQRDEEQVAARMETEKEAKAAAKAAEKARAKPAKAPKEKTAKPPKEDKKNAQRRVKGKAQNGDGGGAVGCQGSVPPHGEPERHEALGTPADAQPERSQDDQQPGGVDQPAVPEAAGPGRRQLSLFDCFGPSPDSSGRKRGRRVAGDG